MNLQSLYVRVLLDFASQIGGLLASADTAGGNEGSFTLPRICRPGDSRSRWQGFGRSICGMTCRPETRNRVFQPSLSS
jgi:hypothetical protein